MLARVQTGQYTGQAADDGRQRCHTVSLVLHTLCGHSLKLGASAFGSHHGFGHLSSLLLVCLGALFGLSLDGADSGFVLGLKLGKQLFVATLLHLQFGAVLILEGFTFGCFMLDTEERFDKRLDLLGASFTTHMLFLLIRNEISLLQQDTLSSNSTAGRTSDSPL